MLFRTKKTKFFFAPVLPHKGGMSVGGSTIAGEEVVAKGKEGFHRILFVQAGEWY
jgi:hypothetical protein